VVIWLPETAPVSIPAITSVVTARLVHGDAGPVRVGTPPAAYPPIPTQNSVGLLVVPVAPEENAVEPVPLKPGLDLSVAAPAPVAIPETS
jgi:hypothetical protein